MNHTDTIAAAATAMGSAGIGIIRISGTDAFAVLEKVFRPKNEKKVMSEQSGYTVHYGMAVDGEQVLDEVLVMLMRGAPQLYGGGYGGDRLSRRAAGDAEDSGGRVEKWRQSRGAGGVYQTGILERADGSVPGRGRHGFDSVEK